MNMPIPNHITARTEAIERIGDEEIYREIAFVFQENLALYIEKLTSATKTGDYSTVRRLAHSIKSNCATIGAEEVRGVFASLEQAAAKDNAEAIISTLPKALTMLAELRHNISSLKKHP